MIKKIPLFFIVFVIILLYSFINESANSDGSKENVKKENPLVTKVISTAISYNKVPYKYGGTTRVGMDCSGLVYTSFKEINRKLPRSSKNMSKEGEAVLLSEVQIGDLLFFDIAKFEGEINHVGLVTSIDNGEVFFIHATTFRGVIITSINEPYWNKAFVKAKRVL
ncbi:NlpC/P60 family protein [Tenacibaculum adriaticum]|uniref:NlpC/P60 family protein n=1 Tax=Tenacibaculum adriaticum TaxID=413713 RepID=A0A5S5DZ13_9FLAO|nr:C40 family peptidase [Tenacibaculum adriaticum]TYQ00479.1 NlpC/P60 family protein [Tenacibaculum adriaticum]